MHDAGDHRSSAPYSKPAPLGDEGEDALAGAARPIDARLPLADGLLAHAQFVGELLLRQLEVGAQVAHGAGVPLCFTLSASRRHARTVHGTVYGGQ